MVHTLELSKMINEEIFEELINSLKGNWYNGVAWYTNAYASDGISMVCLRKFKLRHKDENGNWITLETEPYNYMAILTINVGVMFGGDGYRANNVLLFTPDFDKTIYDRIFTCIPELESNKEYREKGYQILWNTGNMPKELKWYYQLNSFKLRRVDYALDILTAPEQYIQLLEWGKGIRRKSFERLYFDSKANTVVKAEDFDNVLEDEEPDFEDIEDLLQAYTSDEKYIYYKSKSVNINIYLKGEQLKKDKLISPYNTAYNFLRIEIQVKKNKLNYLNHKHNIHGREFHGMPIPEYEKEILSYYINQLSGTGHYVTYTNAKRIIDESDYKPSKKDKLKNLLYLIAKYQSVKMVLDKVADGTITDLGKLSTVQGYIREIQDMGINPVTISRNMKNSILKAVASRTADKNSYSETLLPSLIDIVNAYNQHVSEEHQNGRAITQDDLEQIDKL